MATEADYVRCAKCGHALLWHGDDGGCENGECECNAFMLVGDYAGLTLDLGEGELKKGERE